MRAADNNKRGDEMSAEGKIVDYIGKEIPEPYQSLAQKRRREQGGVSNVLANSMCFLWSAAHEGEHFWSAVDQGERPPIPKGSASEPAGNKTTVKLYGPATAVFWEDGTKTTVKRNASAETVDDREKAFLMAYFQKHSGLSKRKAAKYLRDIVPSAEAEEKPPVEAGVKDGTLGVRAIDEQGRFEVVDTKDEPPLFEVGKRYTKRNGRVTGVLVPNQSMAGRALGFCLWDEENKNSYRPNGHYLDGDAEHSFDLISEYKGDE
jgi:hypothetical protein